MARRTAVFESWRGRYSDSPRAISEHLSQIRPDIPQVWVVENDDVVLPDGLTRVVRNSPDYFRRLLTARWVVTNDAMPRYPAKTSRTTYAQTWHGTPLKRIGFDVARDRYAGNETYLRRLRADVARWDYLVSPSPFATRVFRQAFDYGGEILEVGYPRNDLLAGPLAARTGERVRHALGIDPGTRVVLYAPTWREDSVAADGTPTMSLTEELTALADSVGTGTVVLARLHRLIADRLTDLHEAVWDVSDYPDIQELYLAADVLVTDYSSVMFDFAVTGRPMIFLASDLERYRDVLRGFYFDFEETAPGPVLRRPEEVGDALSDLARLGAEHAERYAAFVAQFCPLEDGSATERVCATVFAGGSHRNGTGG